MSKRIGVPVLAGVLAIGLFGCGHAPTAPMLDASTSAVTKSGAVASSLAPTPGPVGQPGTDPGMTGPSDVIDAPTAISMQSMTSVNGMAGRSLSLGHVRLIVPNHSYRGKADISISEPDPSRLEVHLAITPASKNHFSQPITLIFDAAGCGEDCRLMQIQWFDPAQNLWVPIESSVDIAAGTISAQLPHFSKYRAVCEAKRVGW